jgi:hypothetical protein
MGRGLPTCKQNNLWYNIVGSQVKKEEKSTKVTVVLERKIGGEIRFEIVFSFLAFSLFFSAFCQAKKINIGYQ